MIRDSASHHVRGSSRHHDIFMLHSSSCAQFCTHQKQRCVHAPSTGAFHVFRWKSLLLLSLRRLLSHWSRKNHLPRPNILSLFWFFSVGAASPIIFYFAARKWLKTPIKYLHGTPSLRWSWLHPPHPIIFPGALSDTSSKSISGQVLRVVITIEPPDELGLRFGTCVKYAVHLLRIHIG